VGSLSRLVDEVVAAWEGPLVENEVFASSDPDRIAEMIDSFCEVYLRSHVVGGLFYSSSVGCVTGAALSDGRVVVIKAYQPRWTVQFLTAVVRIQDHLARAGFPCAQPFMGPEPLGRGFAVVEQLVPDPGPRHLGRAEMSASAGGLAAVVAVCHDLDPAGLSPHPLDAAANGLYPVPHHPAFDFAATSSGAEWIDVLARAAVQQRETGNPRYVIAHTDWSARNVRLGPSGVVAAYDWDSLAAVPETIAVGQAAMTWSSVAADEPALAPSADEVVAYVKAYEEARGRTFSAAEWDAIGAAALWVLAYTARCEHALWPAGSGPQRARGRLRADGNALLCLSDARN
jgi:hypothetical protein